MKPSAKMSADCCFVLTYLSRHAAQHRTAIPGCDCVFGTHGAPMWLVLFKHDRDGCLFSSLMSNSLSWRCADPCLIGCESRPLHLCKSRLQRSSRLRRRPPTRRAQWRDNAPEIQCQASSTQIAYSIAMTCGTVDLLLTAVCPCDDAAFGANALGPAKAQHNPVTGFALVCSTKSESAKSSMRHY